MFLHSNLILISRTFCKAGFIFAAVSALIASAILLSAALLLFIYKNYLREEVDDLMRKLIENEAKLLVMLLILLIIGILIVHHYNSKLLKLANINMAAAILYLGVNLSSYFGCYIIFRRSLKKKNTDDFIDYIIFNKNTGDFPWVPMLILSLVMLALVFVASIFIWKDLHSKETRAAAWTKNREGKFSSSYSIIFCVKNVAFLPNHKVFWVKMYLKSNIRHTID